MVLSHKVIVKEGGIHGFCWFAGEDIKAGEMIWAARGPVVKSSSPSSSSSETSDTAQQTSDPSSPAVDSAPATAEAPYLNFYQTWDQIQAMSEKTRESFLFLAYQVSDTTWLGIDPNAVSGPELIALQQELYINHSCDGNVWHQGDSLLVARRDIAKGEELCYDYALTESDEAWVLAERCLCGARDCRVRVCGGDWRLPAVQAKYGRHFLSYILEKIDKAHAAAGAGPEGKLITAVLPAPAPPAPAAPAAAAAPAIPPTATGAAAPAAAAAAAAAVSAPGVSASSGSSSGGAIAATATATATATAAAAAPVAVA